ncbi:hypothetical protein ACLQUA_004647 [Enterobacter ludwigii]|uniref:Uncharacterized protein n=2 Tax=Enterobacter cloacae complex TaxID=354276 RepID=A0A0H3ZNF5_ENTCL|nr:MULTISPECIES: hypothetical protein [Enterobacteriaceae]AKN35349.1 hypothetical protein [Enterobacter cloacae]AKN35382.1 hypothetical protein [Enterobacter cloacae]AKN35445.1 hypothetical protein [Enterobacter cloacae]AKN35479.1 hypothetical protein [Enterobacter cloacae]AOW71206.1 hypothetical protein [Enterobacter cloacae]
MDKKQNLILIFSDNSYLSLGVYNIISRNDAIVYTKEEFIDFIDFLSISKYYKIIFIYDKKYRDLISLMFNGTSAFHFQSETLSKDNVLSSLYVESFMRYKKHHFLGLKILYYYFYLQLNYFQISEILNIDSKKISRHIIRCLTTVNYKGKRSFWYDYLNKKH